MPSNTEDYLKAQLEAENRARREQCESEYASLPQSMRYQFYFEVVGHHDRIQENFTQPCPGCHSYNTGCCGPLPAPYPDTERHVCMACGLLFDPWEDPYD